MLLLGIAAVGSKLIVANYTKQFKLTCNTIGSRGGRGSGEFPRTPKHRINRYMQLMVSPGMRKVLCNNVKCLSRGIKENGGSDVRKAAVITACLLVKDRMEPSSLVPVFLWCVWAPIHTKWERIKQSPEWVGQHDLIQQGMLVGRTLPLEIDLRATAF